MHGTKVIMRFIASSLVLDWVICPIISLIFCSTSKDSRNSSWSCAKSFRKVLRPRSLISLMSSLVKSVVYSTVLGVKLTDLTSFSNPNFNTSSLVTFSISRFHVDTNLSNAAWYLAVSSSLQKTGSDTPSQARSVEFSGSQCKYQLPDWEWQYPAR